MFRQKDAGLCWVISEGFIEEVFVVVDGYFFGMGKLVQDGLGEVVGLGFLLVVDEHGEIVRKIVLF